MYSYLCTCVLEFMNICRLVYVYVCLFVWLCVCVFVRCHTIIVAHICARIKCTSRLTCIPVMTHEYMHVHMHTVMHTSTNNGSGRRLPVVLSGGEASGPLYPPAEIDETMFSCEHAAQYAYHQAQLSVEAPARARDGLPPTAGGPPSVPEQGPRKLSLGRELSRDQVLRRG